MSKLYFSLEQNPQLRFISSLLALTLTMATLQHTQLFNLTHPNDSYPPPPTGKIKSRRKTLLIVCSKPNNEDAWKEKKQVSVNYDKGNRQVSVHLSGLRKDDLSKRYRLRVEGDRFQKDWAISEVVQKISKLNHWEDIEGVLNRWVGRFARKNFPVLIRVIQILPPSPICKICRLYA